MTAREAHSLASPPERLRRIARRQLFWIVGGTSTGAALVALGALLGLGKLPPPWAAAPGAVAGAVLAFGIVVWVHALDVGRDRRTLLRIARELEARETAPHPPAPESGARP